MSGEDSINYRSVTRADPLSIPPDLTQAAGDPRYKAPAGSTTFSQYQQSQVASKNPQEAARTSSVLPERTDMRVERDGDLRWLVISMPPDQVFPKVSDFWTESGFVLDVVDPKAGLLVTNWAENRAKIGQDFIRNFLGKVLDSLYSTGERDKFRTRLEAAAGSNATEIYVSHRGMVEVFEGTQGGSDQGQGRTMWQPRPSDPELEAEMLRRLMLRFGVEESRAKALVAEKAPPPRITLGKSPDGSASLTMPDAFDRAWRRVGLALDRIGFAVEDRDRAGGVYYVRYADPDANTKKEKGFLSRLAFWSSDETKAKALKYQVRLKASGELTGVGVYMEDGKPANNETGGRILNLLYEQLQ